MRKLVVCLICACCCLSLSAADISDVWKAFEQGDRAKARTILNELIKDPQMKVDATMTLMLLNYFESREENLALFENVFSQVEDPSPYLFAFWFDQGVTDGYGKKDAEHLAFLKKIIADPRVNGSIKAAGNYIMGMHFTFSNKLKNAQAPWDLVGSIKDWQYVGPFENSSGSGFSKHYEPIDEPQPSSIFVSKDNYQVQWFVPKYQQTDPWMTISYHVNEVSAVVFAQSFVECLADQEMVVSLGGCGSVKLWINDSLILAEEEERNTELDIYKYKIVMPKGINRVLVQVGYTSKIDYPNFVVRLLDAKSNAIPGLKYSSTYQPYNSKDKVKYLGELPLFAETFFKDKIQKDSSNIINYLLLAKVYRRCEKISDAIEILKLAERKAPKNILVHTEFLLNFSKIDNQTEVSRQLEAIRDLDAENPLIAGYDFSMNLDRKKLDEAEESMNLYRKCRGVDDETYYTYKIRLLMAKNDYDEMLDVINDGYAKFPESVAFVNLRFAVLKSTNETDKGIALLENYLTTHFNAGLYKTLIDEYKNMGNFGKVEKLKLHMLDLFPAEMDYIKDLANYYYSVKNYSESIKYMDRAIANAPYSSSNFSDRGYINMAMNNNADAIRDFSTAIKYNPNLFTAREKLRELKGQPTLLSYLRRDDAYSLIKASLKNADTSDYNVLYVFDDRNFIYFSEGASVEYSAIAVKMLNDAGVNRWKESSIGYNPYWQYLVIEKAEVVKKNGSRIKAELNDSQIVFTSLEIGDVVYIEYRIDNYSSGKLRREFWDDEVFNGFSPTNVSTYRLLIPENLDITMLPINFNQQPETKKIDEFTCLTWKVEAPEVCKDEDFMPATGEVGMCMQVSTVKSWSKIADWYRDLAMPLSREDYYVNEAYKTIFDGKSFSTETEKAKAIYDFIAKNIRYSSVPFRQGRYVPQRPMVTLSSQLGDCKDLSLLFYTLAKKAGIKSNLVLVSTRGENGENTMRVPSNTFNHCIVRALLDGNYRFIELTDSKLPFGYLPNSVANSQALIIPSNEISSVPDTLIHITEVPENASGFKRTTVINVVDEDMKIHTEVTAKGTCAAGYRENFAGLTKEKTKVAIEDLLRKPFKNNLKIGEYKLDDLEGCAENFNMSVDFTTEDELVTMGGVKSIKVPFLDELISLDGFPDKDRKYTLNYWQYEPNDYYEDDVTVNIPATLKFSDIPENFSIKTDFIEYTLTYTKINDNTLKVNRKVKVHQMNIPASGYVDFRNAVRKIVKAEDANIGFK
jgi:tetratricopeptide (TPR) repeat protein